MDKQVFLADEYTITLSDKIYEKQIVCFMIFVIYPGTNQYSIYEEISFCWAICYVM